MAGRLALTLLLFFGGTTVLAMPVFGPRTISTADSSPHDVYLYTQDNKKPKSKKHRCKKLSELTLASEQRKKEAARIKKAQARSRKREVELAQKREVQLAQKRKVELAQKREEGLATELQATTEKEKKEKKKEAMVAAAKVGAKSIVAQQEIVESIERAKVAAAAQELFDTYIDCEAGGF